MSRFQKETFKKLKLAGWYPNRRVDISEIILSLSRVDYCINESIQEFLKEFSNISLIYNSGEEPFSLTYRYSNITLEIISIINNSICEPSLPIGFLYNGEFVIAVTESNKMFAISENYNHSYQIGSYFDEGLEFLCRHGLNPIRFF